MMRMAADAFEDFDKKIRSQMSENREQGVDSQSLVDAVATLGAGGAALAMELIDKLPKPGRVSSSCDCGGDCGSTGPQDVTINQNSSVDIASEVEKAASRMGLVQEDELAALRKRVIELEELIKGLSAK